MRVGSAIAARRDDRRHLQRSQALASAAAQRWREEARVAPVLAEIREFGRGAPLVSCPALAALFEGAQASDLAATLCRGQAEAMADDPFMQPAFRHNWDGRTATLLLGRDGLALLSLVAVEPGYYPAATAVFSDAVRHEVILSGRAAARRAVRRVDGGFTYNALELGPGARLALDLACQALLVERVETRLVLLRLYRASPDPAPTREYDLASGHLIHQASGDARASRHEAMLALLGRMGRKEAAPAMAATARGAGPDGLRWQALREALALDTAEGFRALCDVARTPDDPLAMPAAALRAQLVEAHPELLALEEAPCRA